MTDVIPRFEGDFFFLSNFFESPVTIDVLGRGAVSYMTAEHAFQAYKAVAMPLGNAAKELYINGVWKADSPKYAKYLGRSVKIDVATWDNMKVSCMRHVVFSKFNQDADLRRKLLSTGHAMLVEGNTWGDTYWGRCAGKGSNVLGSILMEVRGYWFWESAPR